jgi:fructose-1,6-bisphosphatase I / sedoheptulose-1,7-bisphosphatase
MMSNPHTTLTQFFAEERNAGAPPDLAHVIGEVGLACKIMAMTISKWPLARPAGAAGDGDGAERVPRLPEPSARDILLRAKQWSAHLGHTMWTGTGDLFAGLGPQPRNGYRLVFEPVDRWINLDINVAVGSVFSVAEATAPTDGGPDGLPAGNAQVCAGYAIYGPSTTLVVATERGVSGFTLDFEVGEFVLTHPRLTIAEDAQDFAINTSASRYWPPAIKRYVEECVAGRGGPRGRDFNMRWNGSLVTELHRTLIRGGVCCYPRDPEGRNEGRCLRLVQDANPVAYVVERAGGRASTGAGRVLDVEPRTPAQRVGIVFGARAEVDLIERYHRESAQGTYTSPLFNTRGLFESEMH